MVGLPTQISQRSQGFAHWVTWVQAGHLAGLPKSAAVQPAAMRIGVATPGTAQQPKQSQPFGTSGRHLFTQSCDCDAETEHSVACLLTRSPRRRGSCGVGVQRIALELPVAAVVARARVAVEEAVLLAGVHVVARDAGRERALVVVERARRTPGRDSRGGRRCRRRCRCCTGRCRCRRRRPRGWAVDPAVGGRQGLDADVAAADQPNQGADQVASSNALTGPVTKRSDGRRRVTRR